MRHLALLALAPLLQAPARAPDARLESLAGAREPLALADLTLARWQRDGAWLELPATAAVDAADQAELRLRDGDRLYGALRGGAKEDLLVTLPGGAIVALPLGDLDALVVASRIPAGRELELAAPPSGDRLLRALGGSLDRLDGTLVGFADAGVEFESASGVRTIAWAEVAALYVEAIGERKPRAAGAQAVALDLAGGGALRGELVGLGSSGVELVRPGGQSLRLSWSALTGLARDDGRFAWISQLPRVGEQPCKPFGDELGMVWHASADRCAAGGPLRTLQGVVARGVGMHAPSSVSFELGARFRHLRGRVALDASVRGLPAQGSVVFEVRGDGKSLWKSALVRGAAAPLELPALDVAGVKVLELVADDGGDGFSGDRANWLELRASAE
ncbi:MAG: hypothetical protein EPO68_09730 [Planctomycetota bacterium]|nr:MAG: hypothetical protein EPO68_09730 [Planctomycetota bacterium]